MGVREDPGGAPIAGAASWAFSSSCSRAGVRMAMGIAQGSGPITPMSGRAGSVTCDTAPGAAQDFGGRLARARGLPQPLCSQLSAQPHCGHVGVSHCKHDRGSGLGRNPASPPEVLHVGRGRGRPLVGGAEGGKRKKLCIFLCVYTFQAQLALM